MKRFKTFSKLTCLLWIMILCCLPQAQAQSPYGDVSDLKKEVRSLKSQIQELTTLVWQMRKALLESCTTPPVPDEQKESTKPLEPAKQAPAVDEEQLTGIICKAVGDFFPEAEAALRLPDPEAAREQMRKTLLKLTSKLHGYKGTHRVDKLLGIYEGLAWDTYTAVQLRQSIEGNEAFLESLRRHKQKFIETCPRK